MAGRFTVNVVVGKNRARLGQLRETPWTRFVDRMVGARHPFVQGLLLPRDKWWRISEDQLKMDQTMTEVLNRLIQDAVPRIEASTET